MMCQRILVAGLGLALCLGAGAESADESPPTSLLLVVGASGDPEFQPQFDQWAKRWQSYASAANADLTTIGLDDDERSDRDRLQESIRRLAQGVESPMIVAMIGHGTHFGGVSKFNLRGPDVTDKELAEWLAPVQRPLAVIQCSSSSAPFLATLSGEGRVVVTATRSGSEQNFSRFGDFFSAALTDAASDLDHDHAISLLEAFLFASKQVAEFYDGQSRLATEHPLLDDNGDGRGTPGEFFRGIRAQFAADDKTPVDGLRAHQFILSQLAGRVSLPTEALDRRDELERKIEALRQLKAKLSEDEYLGKLEPLLVDLARLYSSAETSDGDDAAP